MKSIDPSKVESSFLKFVEIIQALRHPETGCPWDLQQTHKSLRKYMIEEAYEAAEVMDGDDSALIIEELGDVLLQVVLNSQLLADADQGSIIEVIEGISSKMIRRHPHVLIQALDRSRLLRSKKIGRASSKRKSPFLKKRVCLLKCSLHPCRR